MSQYRVARAAQQDLDAIWCYIGSSDLAAADRWVDKLEEHFQVLARQPHAEQARRDLAPEVRILPVGKLPDLLPTGLKTKWRSFGSSTAPAITGRIILAEVWRPLAFDR